MIFLFDLDGTLCDLTHRLHFIESSPKDWDSFYKACVDDKPIFETITVARALASAGHTLLYSTGRSFAVRTETLNWLQKFRLPNYKALYMRPDGDHREDYVVKGEILDNIINDYSLRLGDCGGVFEDRQSVVDMYRARGLRVFQVAKGNF